MLMSIECPTPSSGWRGWQFLLQQSNLDLESLWINVLKRRIPPGEVEHNAALGWVAKGSEVKRLLLCDQGPSHVAVAFVFDSDALLLSM